MQIEQAQAEVSIKAEPKWIKAGYGAFDKWAVTKNAIIMTKGSDFIYLIGVT